MSKKIEKTWATSSRVRNWHRRKAVRMGLARRDWSTAAARFEGPGDLNFKIPYGPGDSR